MSIAKKEGEGGLWYKGAFKIFPKFELQTQIRIPIDGCKDLNSWSFDGFTMILTQTKPPYASGGGGYIGYNNIYNALVIEVDLVYNEEYGDSQANSLSLHRCYGINCSPVEGPNTVQRNLPIVIFKKNKY